MQRKHTYGHHVSKLSSPIMKRSEGMNKNMLRNLSHVGGDLHVQMCKINHKCDIKRGIMWLPDVKRLTFSQINSNLNVRNDNTRACYFMPNLFRPLSHLQLLTTKWKGHAGVVYTDIVIYCMYTLGCYLWSISIALHLLPSMTSVLAFVRGAMLYQRL